MAAEAIPQSVLTEAFAEAIAHRRVHAAVFTTFSFDPGFFELHILPLLFDYSFSHVEKIRLVQLEEQLGTIGPVAVYYDRSALAQEAIPAQLDFRRIDVRRSTGVFHPKVALILVENELEGDESYRPLSLLVGVFSANLTRAGWWENVEVAHFEEIDDKDVDTSRCSYRSDLLSLIRRIRSATPRGESHVALDAIHQFITQRTVPSEVRRNRAQHRYYTRLYCGQRSFPEWIEEIGLGRDGWNLEIVSPYFDQGHASTVESLIDTIQPKEVRIFLPVDIEGVAQVDEVLFHAVPSVASWSSLPSSITQAGRKADLKAAPRRVHAKIYRLWNRDAEVIIVGSINLTSAGHSHGRAGNLEAAFLIDRSDAPGRKQWWLQPVDERPTRFAAESPSETDQTDEVCIDISFRFDWRTRTLSYRISSLLPAGEQISIEELNGARLFDIAPQRTDVWVECEVEQSQMIESLLQSTSFLQIRHPRGVWRALIREESMAHKPSLLLSLTPEEILMYWSMLTPDQQAAFIEARLIHEGTLEGLSVRSQTPSRTDETIFGRFAGIYHAFHALTSFVERAIQETRGQAAIARLAGAKYDSLPELLRKTLQSEPPDAVTQYVIFLCAQQLLDRIAQRFPQFLAEHDEAIEPLRVLLGERAKVRDAVQLEGEDGRFFEWYEPVFLESAQKAIRA